MTCGLQPIQCADRWWFEMMEDEVATCDADLIGYFDSEAAMHAAAAELADLPLDSNIYYDRQRRRYFCSLWCYRS